MGRGVAKKAKESGWGFCKDTQPGSHGGGVHPGRIHSWALRGLQPVSSRVESRTRARPLSERWPPAHHVEVASQTPGQSVEAKDSGPQ